MRLFGWPLALLLILPPIGSAFAQDRVFRRGDFPEAQVVAGDEYDGRSGRYHQEFTLSSNGLLVASATATASYSGQSAAAGVFVDISINEASCARDQSALNDAQSWTFHANATCIRWLRPGEYRISVTRTEEKAEQSLRLTVSYFVLAVASNR
jgi:hypothetical protein